MDAPRRVILFDIDGTLINSGGSGAASWRLAFDELYGIPADISEITDIGLTDPDVGLQTFQSVLHRDPTDDEFTHLLDRRLHYLRQAVATATGYRVLPGVDALLPRLLDQGYLLGLVTGNLEVAAHIKLHRAGLNRYFAFGGYGSDDRDRGQLTRIALARAAVTFGAPLEPGQCLAVGDTPHDVTAAHAAGIACIGVANPHFSMDQLRQSGADFVVDSLEDELPLD